MIVPPKVFLIDDDELIVSMLTRALKGEGRCAVKPASLRLSRRSKGPGSGWMSLRRSCCMSGDENI